MEAEAPDLPVEVICYIMRFLSLSDRKEASLVNRAWYAASLDRSLQKDVIYNLQASSTFLESLRDLGWRQSLYMALSNLDGAPISKMVIQSIVLHLAAHLENLSLRGSYITEASFVTLITACHNLRGLDISGCNCLFMSGTLLSKDESKVRMAEALVNLKELNLSNLRYLSDLTFDRLTDCTPNLRKLSLASCHITFGFDPYHGANTSNSTAVLSLRNILRFINRRAATLKILNLSRTTITSEAVLSVVQVAGLCLEGLELQHCKGITDEAVSAICACQPGLATLDLTGCAELTGKSVLAIASSLRCLECLSLGRIRHITDSVLKDLPTIRTLQALDISECYQVSGCDLVKGLASPKAASKLVRLNFSCCTMVNDSCLFSMAKILGRNLRELDLTSCLYISDISVHAIANHLRGLTVLRLGWCKKITDWGLLGLIKANDDSQPHNKEIRFDELRTLSLSMVREITDESIVSIATHCRSLEQLSLSHCGQLTDQGLIGAVSHLKRLTHLDISCCDKITIHLFPCRKVESDLVLVDVTPPVSAPRMLEVLLKECKWLESLDVSMCGGLTIADIEGLQLLHPTLTDVHARCLGEADLPPTLGTETGQELKGERER
ncbi:F-box/LRR-repeat protein 2 isoform X3 [Pristis pectinata]|uniref:F-box/LRR-repeat protein 2 isoform X3 n=1 Tax=Pristis pectinata TaxID=685728 RepID=UPI00223E3908|nr:F-box/LRR-repeat protein 2 isoform X3 [Pristis pectinata]